MNIAVLIPLILEIHTSVKLNLIQNQRNTIVIEFVGELYIAMQKNLDQNDITVGLKFDLDVLVAELAARGTCLGEYATRGT